MTKQEKIAVMLAWATESRTLLERNAALLHQQFDAMGDAEIQTKYSALLRRQAFLLQR